MSSHAATKWLVLGLAALCAQSSQAADGDILAREIVVVDHAMLPDGVPGDEAEQLLAGLRQLASQVTVEAITYESDGLKVQGFLAVPKTGETLPCLIANRGGNRDFGSWSPYRALRRLGDMARHGYVVAASQYRGVDGGEGMEEFGGAELADVLNLLPLLEQVPRADATRVGIWGWSRGGMTTYQALAATDRFRAAVIGAGPTDVESMVRDRPEMEAQVLAEMVPGWQEHRAEKMLERSPLSWPEKLSATTPILLLHGTGDWRVDVSHSLRMATALYQAKRPYRLIVFEGGDHGLGEFQGEVEAQVMAWFDRFVRDGEGLPNLEPHGQ